MGFCSVDIIGSIFGFCDIELISKYNFGGEFMPVDVQDKIKKIGQKTWSQNGIEKPLLTKNEI